MSLRRKLILLLVGLTTSVLLVAGAIAYQEVRQASRVAVDERVTRVVEQLTSLAATTTVERLRLKEEVGTSPELRALLRGQPVDTAGVVDALTILRAPSDSGLAIQLWDANGRRVFSDLPPDDPLSPDDVPLETTPSYGSFRPRGDQVRYWSTAPVRSEAGRILGWVVQERRIGNAATAAQLEQLVGSDSRIIFAIPGDSIAVTLAGEAIEPPPTGLPTDALLAYERDGRSLLARAGHVPATPWVVLVEIPTSAMEARPATFLRHMGLAGLGLLLAAIMAAYFLGRQLTEPIDRLVAASESMARGDYSGKVSTLRGGAELDRLARAFNVMARRVELSHEELKRRLLEERKLSRDLRESSVRAEAARREAVEANRAKADFLATMSHEIRTPINAVVGYCDLLELQISGRLTAEQMDQVARIRRSSHILRSLIEDLLDFAHLDAGQLRIEKRPSPARDAIMGAASALEPQAIEKGLFLEIDAPNGLRFLGDPDRVEQILMNLLSNAVKFTEDGGITVRAFEDSAAPPAAGADAALEARSWVRIEVEDTGPGIEEDALETLFEPFVQGDMSLTRRYGGTGLGLSISRELAQMMGGDVTGGNADSRGARFVLWLPSVEAARVA